jgi:hypothetical protein
VKTVFHFNAIVRAATLMFAGAAACNTTHASQWYTKDAYATPDSVQQIGSMPPPRARWVAPPPPVAVAPPPPVAVVPEPEPAPACTTGYDMWGYCLAGPVVGGGGSQSDSQEASGGDGVGCFLTTATVHAMGKADNGEELTMARFLRDNKMTDGKGRAATELYYLVGPKIVERKKDWKDFYASTVQPLTTMVKAGHHELAIKRYSLETAKLVDLYATRYEDKELVQAVYDYAFGKGSFGNSVLPYPVKYAKLKAALKAGVVLAEDKLNRQQAALGLAV